MSTKENDGEKQGDKSDYNPKLDFLSDQFDPLLALNTPGVVVPVPTAKIYDNISVYKSAHNKPKPQVKPEMKKTEARACPSSSSEGKTTETTQRRWLPHQMPIPTIRREVNKNLFTRMAEMQGPLALLKKCVDQRLKIKVHTRRGHELRGYCIGYISLFDKHWNMVLEDVYEEWEQVVKLRTIHDDNAQPFTPLVDPPENHITLKAKVKAEKRRKTCSRTVKCVLMRGEHVSHIFVLNDDDKKS